MKKKNFQKAVAFQDRVVSIERLPFPYVLYPGFYGAFFAFRELPNAPIFLCSCSKKALKNYIILKSIDNSIGQHDDPRNSFILPPFHFPIEFTEELMKKTEIRTEAILDQINFKQNLCHECNKVAPNFRYCHEMYGGSFKQTYGWYIEKQRYEFGIVFKGPKKLNEFGQPDLKGPYSLRVMLDECPHNLYSLIKDNKFSSFNEENNVVDYVINRPQNNEIHNVIENYVRLKLGFKKVGESWVNETLLFNTIKSMFPDYHVFHHYRPDFLKGLEIDVYIEELKTGFEYQGIQHYQPLKHFGGEKSHADLKSRDKLKKRICEEFGIKLCYITYEDDVCESLIKMKMSES
jgi:hypothetical protein